MAKKKTHEEYVEELKTKNPTVEVVGEYINAKTSILHRCKICKNEWLVRPDNILNGKCCPRCANEKRAKSKARTHEQYVNEVKNINSSIIIVGQYINARILILHKCMIDGYEWYAAPDKILNGQGCPKCANNIVKTQNEYIDNVAKINPDIEVIGEYINAITPILHKCKIDKNIWSARPNDILSGKGCPQCSESHGERLVRQWLINNNIQYTSQKVFDGCVDERPLPFDFYLQDYNVCIEYQGIQHYKPVEHFGGKNAFEKLQYHDNIKKRYCEVNNIRLLCVSYCDDIDEQLNNFLFI